MPEKQKVTKQDVWRICNKIRAAVCGVGLDLWEYYKPLDPDNQCLISESTFISVLAGPLKDVIDLSNKEMCDLTDYFRIQGGRIFYPQFCEAIHDNVPDYARNKSLVTDLECEDPLQVNFLSGTETRKLNLIITQLVVLINKRKITLLPYFQDYEQISKNVGTVTIVHFGRILKFLDIILGAEEFRLLVKKFARNAYAMNYMAFLKAIDEVQHYLDEYGTKDLAELDQFPSRIITAELTKLPRSEIDGVISGQIFGRQSVFHPVMEPTRDTMPTEEVIKRIQRHVLERRIRIYEFFQLQNCNENEVNKSLKRRRQWLEFLFAELHNYLKIAKLLFNDIDYTSNVLQDYEYLNSSRVTVSQFRRALDALQISSLGQLWLIESEIDAVIALYTDPDDFNCVCWRRFVDDIDRVFTVKGLDKLPNLKVESPPQEIAELPRRGVARWQCESEATRELCEQVLQRVRRRVEGRRICLRRFFKNYDKHNCGHVTRAQLRQVFVAAIILLSLEEMFALERRYNDNLGFDYNRFLEELEARPIEESLYQRILEEKKILKTEKPPSEPHEHETNIVLILAKIKAKIVRERIKVLEFMKQFDRNNHLVITKPDFIRSLDQLRCNLTPAEVDTIVTVFQAPLKSDFVEYARFAATVEEAVTTAGLEKTPLFVPLQHVPSEASERTFLNFEERQTVEIAMDKLCKVQNPNLEELFKNYDKENIGTVSKEQLMKALSLRRMLELITNKELDAVHKCFSIERGGRLEIDYRAFLRALYLLQENRKVPFF